MIDTDKILKQLDGIELEPPKKEMRTGKSKSWLGEWHWVSLPISEKEKLTEAEAWCKDQFGKSGSRWSTTKEKFFFSNERDLTMFILKWAEQ